MNLKQSDIDTNEALCLVFSLLIDHKKYVKVMNTEKLLNIILLLIFPFVQIIAKPVEIAAFYYPYHHEAIQKSPIKNGLQNQWKFVKSATPKFDAHRQPKKPYLDLPDSANAKQVELEIDLASENAIDIFLYNFYWHNGEANAMQALEDGFLKAKNNKKMKFALIWNNGDILDNFRPALQQARKVLFKSTHSEKDTLHAIDYCIEKYFSKENYWKVDGKFYIAILSPKLFIEKIGDAKKVKKLFDKINDILKSKNLPAIHWAANTKTSKDSVLFEKAGFSSTFTQTIDTSDINTYKEKISKKDYIFEYSDLVQASKNIWQKLSETSLKNIPVVMQGWDCSALCKQKVKFPYEKIEYPYLPIVINNTSEKFESLLKDAQQFAKDKKSPAIFINAWNNWLEGNAVFPEHIEGMNFLRSVSRVFAPESKTLTFATAYEKRKLYRLPQPDFRINYAEYGKNAFDFWKAKNTKSPAPTIVYLHGGGWTNNYNLDYRFIRLFRLRDKGFNLAAVSYRFTQEVKFTIYPAVKAPMQDCANALALIVEKAKELNVDTSRITMAGGSAGACSSLWIALNAGKKLDSGRVIPKIKMISVVVPQTSLDPVQMKEWIPNSRYGYHAFTLKNFDEFLKKRDDIFNIINQYSPYALLSPEKNKTKLFLHNKYKPEVGTKVKDPTHASAFCIKFKEKCDELKIPCIVIFEKDDWDATIKTIEENL